jgi:hypothetical protein
MCASIAVAVVALVLLVVLWTKQTDLQAETKKAQDDARRQMSSAEQSGSFRSWLDKAAGGRTVVGLLGEELGRTTQLITGDEAAVQPGAAELLQGRIDALWDRISSDKTITDAGQVVGKPLIPALEGMYDLYLAENKSKLAGEARVAELSTQLDALTQEKQTLASSFDQKSAELADQVATIEADRVASQESHAKEFQDLQAASAARSEEERRLRDEVESRLKTESEKLAKSEQARHQMQDKLREFQIQPKQGGSARRADGRILLATPGSESVFVDLGYDDKLILGMRFAVYSAGHELPGSGQAKAAVEVLDIGEEVTECLIKWSDPVNPILNGDVVANPIYDRDRQLVFTVIGAFDLDHDGRDDIHGAAAIEAVIKDFNGVISEDFPARTDFVIVGARPQRPVLPRDPAEKAAIEQEYEERLAAYQRVFEDAKALSVPMLTQEQFLNFLGRR